LFHEPGFLRFRLRDVQGGSGKDKAKREHDGSSHFHKGFDVLAAEKFS
jgi:hypothetical protein